MRRCCSSWAWSFERSPVSSPAPGRTVAPKISRSSSFATNSASSGERPARRHSGPSIEFCWPRRVGRSCVNGGPAFWLRRPPCSAGTGAHEEEMDIRQDRDAWMPADRSRGSRVRLADRERELALGLPPDTGSARQARTPGICDDHSDFSADVTSRCSSRWTSWGSTRCTWSQRQQPSAEASRRHFVLMSLLWSRREDLNR